MDLLYKKLLYFMVINIFLLTLPVMAGSLRVTNFSSPISFANKVSQPINIIFSSQGNWKILVQAIEPQVFNQNSNYSLPITRLELAELGGNPIVTFDVGKIIELKSGTSCGINNLNLALNLTTFDNDRPGYYITGIKFTLIDKNSVVAEDIYNLGFMKNEISSIEFANRVTNVSIDKDKILLKNFTQRLSNPVGVYVSSNKDWKLYVKKMYGKTNTYSYLVKVLGADPSIKCNSSGDYVLLNDNSVLLASGKATTNDTMNRLDKRFINIDYMIKSPENKIVPAGSCTEEFEYKLETEN